MIFKCESYLNVLVAIATISWHFYRLHFKLILIKKYFRATLIASAKIHIALSFRITFHKIIIYCEY